jgi:hypothetical protein
MSYGGRSPFFAAQRKVRCTNKEWTPSSASLPEFLPNAIGEVLSAIGVQPRDIDLELAEMDQVLFAKTANRQVLGAMNDFAYQLEACLQDSNNLLDLALKVGDAPMSPLGMQDPIRATLEAFSKPSFHLV